METQKLIIVGSGPAGLTAAIYAARANLKPILFAGISWGGQLMNTTEVENYPGFPEGIQGPELMQKMLKQAEKFGTKIEYKDITKAELKGEIKKLWSGAEEFQAQSVIVATGAEPKLLGLESEQKYWGRGVSACATCDGAFYRGKIVSVVGGGDSAAEEALFLTRFATKVYLIVRREEMRASKIMQERVKNNPQIEIKWNSEVQEILGDSEVMTGLKLSNNKTQKEETISADGMFLAIGHIPLSKVFAHELEINDEGYINIMTPGRSYSNLEGVFIAGDVYDHHYRQAVTAAGMGCMAAIDAERWLESIGS